MAKPISDRSTERSKVLNLFLFLGLLLGSLWIARLTKPGAGRESLHPHFYRPSYFNLRTLGWMVLSLGIALALLGLVVLVLIGIFEIFVETPSADLPPDLATDDELVLQLQSLRSTETALLDTYGWVDREAGIAHIPLDRAIQIVSEQGLPVFESGEISEGDDLLAQGESLFLELGCDSCHTLRNTPTAPTLRGLFGSQVTLSTGEKVIADEEYLRESILLPQARVVRGYSPSTMPSFQNTITPEELDILLLYIQSLSDP